MKKTLFAIKLISPLLALLAVIGSLSSCQKEITGSILDSLPVQDTLPHSVSSKVKTYTEEVTSAAGSQSETFTLSYDSSDRIISIVAASDPGSKFVYQYNADNTNFLDIYVSGVLSIHSIVFLNNIPFIDSTVQYNDTNDTSTEKYTYNAAKQLTSLKEYSFSTATGSTLTNTTTYEYDTAGNVTKETNNFGVTTYDYYTSLVNNLNIGSVYLYRNTNLTKTTTVTSAGVTNTATHTYTFDNNNRIITEKVTADNGDVVVKSYTY